MQRRSINQSYHYTYRSIKKLKIKDFAFGYSLLICLFVYLFIGLFQQVHAQGAGLKLSPSVLQIEAEPPTEINAPLSIENLEDRSVELKTEFRLFKPSDKDDGQVVFLPQKDNNSPIFSKIALLDSEKNLSTLTLGPKQKKDLILKMTVSEDEPLNDHYFSVVFTGVQDDFRTAHGASEQHSISKINAGIAMNVLLSIQNDKKSDQKSNKLINIEEFSAPQVIESGPVPFTISVQNNGSHFISPKGTIEITNMFGQLIGKVEIPSTNVLAGSRRYLESLRQIPTSRNKSATPSVLWQEKFLLGFYSAELKIESSKDGPVLTRKIHFTALPFRLIITVILTTIIFLIIRKRVKAKMSER